MDRDAGPLLRQKEDVGRYDATGHAHRGCPHQSQLKASILTDQSAAPDVIAWTAPPCHSIIICFPAERGLNRSGEGGVKGRLPVQRRTRSVAQLFSGIAASRAPVVVSGGRGSELVLVCAVGPRFDTRVNVKNASRLCFAGHMETCLQLFARWTTWSINPALVVKTGHGSFSSTWSFFNPFNGHES